jgi:tetratricopeptide (TPR) repeat protein
MRTRVVVVMMALTGMAAFAQQPQTPPKQATGNAPKAKSKEEAAAIKKITDAKTADERIAAVDALVTGFPDTAFKATALMEAAEAADSKSDYAKAVSYGELAIQADPQSFYAMLLVAGELAQHTQKYDLDKDQKLGKAEMYVNQAMMIIPTAEKPHSGVSDKDWEEFKKDETAAAHKDMGLIAAARGKFDVAATEYKAAVDGLSSPDLVTMARLADAYNQNHQYAEALATANKVLATPDLNPTVKAFTEQAKANAQKGLGGAK